MGRHEQPLGPGESDDEASSPFTQPRFLIAALLVLCIVAAAIVLVITDVLGDSSPSGPDRPDRPGLQTAHQDAPAQRPDSDSACGLPAGDDDTPPSTGPADTRWELVGSMAAPTAPDTIGPGRERAGVRSCFAHTPLGALFAAVNFWASGTAHPNHVVLEQLAADSPERKQAIRDARTNDQRLDSRTKLQIAGFSFLSYASDVATIDLALRLENGALVSLPTTMRWQSGDWKYVIPPTGDPGMKQLPNLTGYATWSGA